MNRLMTSDTVVEGELIYYNLALAQRSWNGLRLCIGSQECSSDRDPRERDTVLESKYFDTSITHYVYSHRACGVKTFDPSATLRSLEEMVFLRVLVEHIACSPVAFARQIISNYT